MLTQRQIIFDLFICVLQAFVRDQQFPNTHNMKAGSLALCVWPKIKL